MNYFDPSGLEPEEPYYEILLRALREWNAVTQQDYVCVLGKAWRELESGQKGFAVCGLQKAAQGLRVKLAGCDLDCERQRMLRGFMRALDNAAIIIANDYLHGERVMFPHECRRSVKEIAKGKGGIATVVVRMPLARSVAPATSKDFSAGAIGENAAFSSGLATAVDAPADTAKSFAAAALGVTASASLYASAYMIFSKAAGIAFIRDAVPVTPLLITAAACGGVAAGADLWRGGKSRISRWLREKAGKFHL